MADYEGKGEYVDTNGSSPLQRAIHADPDDYSDSKCQIHYTKGFVLKNCDKVALKTSNIAPSRSSMPDATREALPKALEKIFQAHKVCSFEHIRQCLIEMALIEAVSTEGMCKELIVAASAVGYREELLQIINQVAINIHDVFVSKSSTDYPQYDGLRRIVIDLLKAERNAKLEKAVVIEAAKMQMNRGEVTDTEFQKVISEFCTLQGSAWVLKGGDPDPN